MRWRRRFAQRLTMPEATPWRALIAAAAQLGLGPREFWGLSLREWRALIAPAAAAEALSRQAFDQLAQMFPDTSYDPN